LESFSLLAHPSQVKMIMPSDVAGTYRRSPQNLLNKIEHFASPRRLCV
jgi:hypothetical protein